MFSNRYKFNPRTLAYEKVELTTKHKLFVISLFIAGFSAFVFLMAFFVFSYVFDTEGYESLQREKKQLIAQYQNLNTELTNINNSLQDLKERDENIYRIIFEADPIPTSIRSAGFGGSDRYERLRGFDNSELIVETARQLDKIKNKLNIQANSYAEIYNLARKKAEELQCIPAIMPVSSEKTYITSYFGYRFHPILRRHMMHDGVDFAGQIGTKIYAPGDGVVEQTSFTGGYGRVLTINHKFGYKTRYAHLYKILVKRGQKVKRGQVIATLGSSGLATGPHLHYEVHKDGVKVNPLHYYFKDLTPEKYNAMLMASKQSSN
jgi:murein DD-endopeptidase MepM/ murein hydrolase activator NlpD